MNYDLEELLAELEDQKYEIYETFVIDFDDVITAINHLKKQLREKLESYGDFDQYEWRETKKVLQEILGVDSDKKEEEK